VVDTNLQAEVVEYIAMKFNAKVLFADLVSSAKAERLRHVIGRFHTVKPNALEAANLSGIAIDDGSDLATATHWFHRQGVKQVCISLGREGLFCSNSERSYHASAYQSTIVNATGAGDACMAGLIYGHLRDLTLEETATWAQAMAALTVGCQGAVHPHMSETLVREFLFQEQQKRR